MGVDGMQQPTAQGQAVGTVSLRPPQPEPLGDKGRGRRALLGSSRPFCTFVTGKVLNAKTFPLRSPSLC